MVCPSPKFELFSYKLRFELDQSSLTNFEVEFPASRHFKVVQHKSSFTAVHLLGTDYLLKCPMLQNSSEGKRSKFTFLNIYENKHQIFTNSNVCSILQLPQYKVYQEFALQHVSIYTVSLHLIKSS